MLSVNIKKTWGQFHLQASFGAKAGVSEVLGVLGASGCGKSLTLRCIAGIETPDEGQIVLDGETLFDSNKRINITPQKRRVGYLFQNYALFPHMTVEKNIFCGVNNEKDPAQRRQALEQIIKMLHLEGLEKHRPHQLSGGQAQRVALARILVNRPRLLLLDEPFSALDSYLRGHLQIEMKRLLEKYEGTVLLVTHNRNEAYHLCEQIAIMDNGTVFAPKPAKTLFADPGTITAAIVTGCKNIVSALKTAENEVEIPDWGIRLATEQPVNDGLCAIGIRAHYFCSSSHQNRFPVYKTDELEEPYEYIIRFRYQNQKPGTPDIWWRMAKEYKPRQMPNELGISSANVQLLYPAATNSSVK